MMLKSFGCSFIFGSDLSDDGRFGGYATFSRLTWPAHLSRSLSMRYHCYARAGAGNLRIMEQILTQAATNEKDFYVISWTWIDRFDYYEDTAWKTVLPVETDSRAEFYYRNFHSEYVDKLKTLSYIRTTIDVLEQKGIPFLMTYMDPLIFDRTWHATPAVTDAQDRIKPYMMLFEEDTFLNWSKKHDYEISATLHPLEAAHRAAADIILPAAQQQLGL